MPGIFARVTPGHTPGHLCYIMKGADHDVILTGEAVKNRAEFLCGRTDMTYNPTIASASVAAIWSLWRSRPGNIVIPGHDIPMVSKEGRPEYLAKREDAIKAWFGDDIDTMTRLELSVR
jgi:N-acyl homoserine lactone hydrolase